MAASALLIIHDEDKQLLLSRVQEIVFVDGVAGFECRRCDRTLIRHYIAGCGHKFCLNCKDLLVMSKGHCPLPTCKQPITNIDLQDVEFERKLYDLRAHCPNKRYGCPFIGQLKGIGGHLRMCRDTKDRALPVPIKGNDVIEAVLRELSCKVDRLSDDVRKVKEEVKAEVDEKLKEMKAETEMLIAKNIAKAEEEMERKLNKMEEHVSAMNVKLFKMDQLLNSLNETLELKQRTAEKQDTCHMTELKQLFNLSAETLMYTWKGLNVSNMVLMKKDVEAESEVLSLSQHGVNAQVKLKIESNGRVWVLLRFLRKGPSDSETHKFVPRVTFVMTIERDGQTADTYIHTDDSNKFGSSLTYVQYSSLAIFEHLVDKPKYKLNEMFSMEVHIETPEMSNAFQSDEGTVRGSIYPYSKIREWRSKGLIEKVNSPYFFTGPKGYRAVIGFEFYHDALDEISWMDVNFRIISGPNDPSLKEPKYKRKVILINQKDPSKSLTRVEECDDYPYHLAFHFPSNVNEFILNDQLMYEASIEIVD